METKVNYAVVGLFVVVLVTGLIAGILWLSSGKQYGHVYDTYLAYMRESVSGLNVNAPVKYRGVEVGTVQDISIDTSDSERVKLVLRIEKGTPIKTDTVAVLRSQGLTGIAYVELSGGTRNAPILEPKPGQEYAVIATGPSLMARLDTAVTHLLTSLNLAAENVNALLDPKNREAISQTLADLRTVSHVLAKRSQTLDQGMADTAVMLRNGAQASAQLAELITQVGRSAESVTRMAGDVSRASNRTAEAAVGVQAASRRIDAQTLPEVQRVLEETRHLAASLRRLSDQLDRNPSVLIYGRQSSPPGPGE